MKESLIQTRIVKYVRKVCPDSVLIANPLSELQLNYNSKTAKFSKLSKMKQAGWEASQPDLMILHEGEFIAIELKTPETNPFRPFRGGGMWIEKSKDFAGVEHVMSQLNYLDRLRNVGFTVALLDSFDSACKLISGEKDHLTRYKFSYGLNPSCEVLYNYSGK